MYFYWTFVIYGILNILMHIYGILIIICRGGDLACPYTVPSQGTVGPVPLALPAPGLNSAAQQMPMMAPQFQQMMANQLQPPPPGTN